MAVLTTDILIEGVRRDVAFNWLGEPANHSRFLQDAFEEVLPGEDTRTFTLRFPAPALRTRTMDYIIQAMDDTHGGRRVLVLTSGKRTNGNLPYSLRTMKPSTNTLVTLHMDYEPGAVLGAIFDAVFLKEALELRFKQTLKNLKAAIEADFC